MRHLTLFFILILRGYLSFGQVFTESNLPIVVINTNGQTIRDEPKIEVDIKIIYNGVGKINRLTDTIYNYIGKTGIELRGSTSQSLAEKKPYSLELHDDKGNNREVSILGMAKTEDWALIAPYADKTQIRDAFIYKLASEIMDWAADTRFCELVINGNYQGIYVFTERIKRGKELVNIEKVDTMPNASGDAVTGGYILKIDKNTGNTPGVEAGWSSNYKMFTYNRTYFQYHYPKAESMKTPQKNYIRNAVNEFEAALISDSFKDSIKGYRKYIDVSSFIDFMILNELSKNIDGYRLSTYFYKNKNSINSKFKMGPIWDFNLGFGNANYCSATSPYSWQFLHSNECSIGNPFWWQRLFEDPSFKISFRDRWLSLRKTTLSEKRVNGLIDSLTNQLKDAQVRNFRRWDYLNKFVWPVPQVAGSYAGEVEVLKSWLAARIKWIDGEVKAFHLAKLPNNISELDVFPNPSVSDINFAFYLGEDSRVTIRLFNFIGHQVLTYNKAHERGDNAIKIKSPATSGLYLYEFLLNDKPWRVGKIYVN
jgi:hypothetical protein